MTEVDECLFSEGQTAFERGWSQGDCPHREAGEARRLWLAGWDEARRFADRCRAVSRIATERTRSTTPLVLARVDDR